ncbi:MAG TPA: ABC transporter ATP-binding protein [Bacteroidales bacterium]|nr:ABC transporter ATP-binding protein [Bacteroidales bacterium]
MTNMKMTKLAELQNISKSYGQQGSENYNLILDHISLEIGENESLAIVGPSGSGKSTLLNILGTLDHPSSGKVFMNGTEVNATDEEHLATLRNRFIGFVFQQHHLLPQLTLIENVLLPVLPVKDRLKQDEAREPAYRLIERIGLKNHLHRRPAHLSVGECQRAAVVRALVNQPRLLLADEPTGSLDASNAIQLGQLLGELNRDENLAVVVVTHSPEIASRMGKIYKLTSGKLHLIENR